MDKSLLTPSKNCTSMSLSNADSYAAEHSCMFVGLFVAASHRTRRRRQEEYPGVGSRTRGGQGGGGVRSGSFPCSCSTPSSAPPQVSPLCLFSSFPATSCSTTDATTTNTYCLLPEPPAIMRLCICRNRSVCSYCVPQYAHVCPHVCVGLLCVCALCVCVCVCVCVVSVCTHVYVRVCTVVHVCVRGYACVRL
jgi:hypothetical protein